MGRGEGKGKGKGKGMVTTPRGVLEAACVEKKNTIMAVKIILDMLGEGVLLARRGVRRL